MLSPDLGILISVNFIRVNLFTLEYSKMVRADQGKVWHSSEVRKSRDKKAACVVYYLRGLFPLEWM